MIRRCNTDDTETILDIINRAAVAYQGVIPDDRWHTPYMDRAFLENELADGVTFFGVEQAGRPVGVMGIQDRGDVTLVRHAYTHPDCQRMGIGSALLCHILDAAATPVLVGTWADAVWAVRFYEQHGFTLVSVDEKNRLLERYWRIPVRQIETSVVLSNKK